MSLLQLALVGALGWLVLFLLIGLAANRAKTRGRRRGR
jgi:hypothetical protein